MKAVLYAQFNPVKTLKQVVGDRYVLRLCILVTLVLVACV